MLIKTNINLYISFNCSTLAELSTLLDSTHLEVRMATGELITVLLEMARECEDMDEYEPDEEFINKLRELATDSQKYRAKKDRKTQRSNFRQILHYVEVNYINTLIFKIRIKHFFFFFVIFWQTSFK